MANLGGFVPFCHLYFLQLWLHCPAPVITSITGKMYWSDPWLAWHVPMSATGSITLRWRMQNAINHFRTHLRSPLHKRSLVTLIILIFRNWSYLTGEKVNQPLLPWPCPRQEFLTFLPLKRYQRRHQHFVLPPNDYAVLLERMCHEAQLLLPTVCHMPRERGPALILQQLMIPLHQTGTPRSPVFLHLNLNAILRRILAQRGLYIAPLYPRN